MGQIVDNAIALRIIYLLVRDFKKWDSYKLGMMDADGKATDKRASNQDERDSWTMLHRLVARLKRIIGLAPGGKTLLGRLTASYLLVRESYNLEYELTDDQLTECFISILETITDSDVDNVMHIFEEIANTTVAIPVSRDNQPSTLLGGNKPKKKKSYRELNLSMVRRPQLDNFTGV
jgi:hypothetical protein